jgi:hypothetical protein
LICYSASLLQQQSSDRLVAGEATTTNFIVFGLTSSGLEPTNYHTRGEHTNHYTIDAVGTNMIRELLVFIVTEEYFPDYLSLVMSLVLDLWSEVKELYPSCQTCPS